MEIEIPELRGRYQANRERKAVYGPNAGEISALKKRQKKAKFRAKALDKEDRNRVSF
jgi:hypothetical protein